MSGTRAPRFLRHGMLAVSILSAGAAGAATYTGSLTGPAESPPNASPGTGATTVTYDSATHLLTVDVTFSGLLGNTTAAHIHCCTATAFTGTAGVATQTPSFSGFPTGVTSGSYNNTFDLTLAASFNPAFVTANGSVAAAEAALAAGLSNGKTYLNVHSTQFGGGEIRSFLQEVFLPVPAISWPGAALLGVALAAAGAVALRRG
jgi:hypothetical protein